MTDFFEKMMLLQRLINRRFTLILSVINLCFISTMLQASNSAQPHWQNKHYIEHSFYDIALRGEHQVVEPVIKKWQKPLLVWATSTIGNTHEQYTLLNSHLTKLTEITHLPIQPTQNARQANVRVFFTTEHQAPDIVAREISLNAVQHLKHSICLGHIRYNRRAEITRATIVIPVQRAQAHGKLTSCIIEELTQMLGLINDSKIVHPTVFNDTTTNDMLTGLDYLLLKLLYSPEIKTGMTINQAAPLVQKRLRRWEQTGLINQAEVLINRARLTR